MRLIFQLGAVNISFAGNEHTAKSTVQVTCAYNNTLRMPYGICFADPHAIIKLHRRTPVTSEALVVHDTDDRRPPHTAK